MIPQRYVREFLSEPRDDHRWLKELKRGDVLDLINDLRPRPKLWPEMRLNQLVAFYLGVAYGFEAIDQGGGFSFWMDMGSGKTLVTLELMKYWHQTGEMERGLVFPLSHHAYPTWKDQVKRFDIGLKCVALEGSSEEKWAALKKFKDGIVLVSYPGAVAMCTKKVQVLNKHKKPTGKMKLELIRPAIDKLMDRVDVMTMDESTRAGHPKSLTHRMCDYIGARVKTRYALAGLPFGREPEILFHQQMIIDGGMSFGETLGMFREAFYSKKQNIWAKSSFAYTYTFRKEQAYDFSRMMQHRSITYEEHECIDVPKVAKIRVPLKLRGEARAYYGRATEELVALAKSGEGTVTATKNAFLRMRQITSGFLGFKNDEDGERTSIEFDQNVKLDSLIDHIISLPRGRKCVVFYEYTYSGRRIVEELKKGGIKSVWLWSGTKDSNKAQKLFKTNPEYTVCVLNNKIGAYSLDGLQTVANYMFFYESPVPVIDRRQAEKRLARSGQKRRVYVYDFVCQGTVDDRILSFHAEGTDLMKAVRKNPRVLLT